MRGWRQSIIVLADLTHATQPVSASALLPTSLWKPWITRVCVTAGAARLGALKRRRRGATLLGRARPRQPPERSGRPDLRGGAVALSVHHDSLKPGHGRLAVAAGQASSGGESNGRSPGFKPLLAGDETSSSGSSAHRSLVVVNPAARGAERGARPDCGERVSTPLQGREIGGAPTPH